MAYFNGKELLLAGLKGPKGDPGLTPYIGPNGTWWIGTADTGVKAGAITEADKQEVVRSVIEGILSSGGMAIPEYDFPALGVPNVVIGGGDVVFEMDTTKLMQDLTNGVVTFKMNFMLGNTILPMVKTCGGAVSIDNGMATITNIDIFGSTSIQSDIMIHEGSIIITARLFDNWITTMIDDYMEEALGGDY